jgi:hypothetical protein
VLNTVSCTLRQFNSFNQKYESTVHLKGPTHLRSRIKTQSIEEKIERNTEKERDINRKKTQRQTDRARGEDNVLHGSSLDKEDQDKSFLDLHKPVNRLQEKLLENMKRKGEIKESMHNFERRYDCETEDRKRVSARHAKLKIEIRISTRRRR